MPTEEPGGGQAQQQVSFDTSVAHAARVYNYWLGGKDNFAADREAAERAIKAYPGIVRAARANRAFLARVVRHLTGEAGIRQFLDIGTGIPAANNTHEVAQAVAPESRIVYVDHDPIVLLHARALLKSSDDGATDYINADLLAPDGILSEATRTLDFSQPIALMLLSTLHLIPDAADPFTAVRRLVGALPPGSYLAISHGAADLDSGVAATMANRINNLMAETVTARSREQVARFFDGLEFIEPGLVRISQWRPDSELESGNRVPLWAGVACRS